MNAPHAKLSTSEAAVALLLFCSNSLLYTDPADFVLIVLLAVWAFRLHDKAQEMLWQRIR